MPIKQTAENRLRMVALLLVGASALAVYRVWGTGVFGNVAFWILTATALILARQLLKANPISKPAVLRSISPKRSTLPLVLGLLCFPGAILWALLFALAARWGVVPATMPVVDALLVAPCGILMACGAFITLKALWGKDA